MYNLILGDCLDIMPTLQPQSIDLVLTDIPYGKTRCKWDSVVSLDKLWECLHHVLKPNGLFITTCSQPYTSVLVSSNLKEFRRHYVWDKKNPVGHLNSKVMPLQRHEDIVVFGQGKVTYNPVMRTGAYKQKGSKNNGVKDGMVYGRSNSYITYNDQYYPTSIFEFTNADKNNRLHPTQKPVSLFEYLIKLHTNEGDVILDPFMGSGTTLVSALRLDINRVVTGIEQDPIIFNNAKGRLAEFDFLAAAC